jgi:RND family efflux transporter MFP subunit
MCHRFSRRLGVGLLAFALAMTAYCHARADEPVVVPVTRPVAREFTDYQDFTGRIAPVLFVKLRARVSSYLDKAPFQEGSLVKKGDVLFVLDPRPYQAELDRAKAGVIQAEARFKQAEADLQRARKLRNAGVTGFSQEEFDKITANRIVAAAAVQAAKATVEVAALNLEFTRVTAPFAGRIGRRFVDPGNLVKGDDTVLSTLVSTGPVYCYFDMDERTLLRLRKLLLGRDTPPLLLGLANERGFPHKGTCNLIDNKVDENTGTIRLRGVFDNPHGVLMSGMFARVRLPLGKPRKVLEVPELAVLTKDSRKFVYVIGDNNKVVLRPVRVGQLDGDLRVIETGLKPDDWVAVSALGKFAEGDTVEPKRTPLK